MPDLIDILNGLRVWRRPSFFGAHRCGGVADMFASALEEVLRHRCDTPWTIHCNNLPFTVLYYRETDAFAPGCRQQTRL